MDAKDRTKDKKTAVYLARLEKVIRDLEPADPAWQVAAGEYTRLKKNEEIKRPSGQDQPPAPWER